MYYIHVKGNSLPKKVQIGLFVGWVLYSNKVRKLRNGSEGINLYGEGATTCACLLLNFISI